MSSTRTDEEEQWQWSGDTPAAEEQEAIHEQRQREETVVVEVLIRTSFRCSKKRMMKMVTEKVSRTL